ncbi:MAG: BclA C-terminal domain-containing protein, partial [Christensenellales bacterium]
FFALIPGLVLQFPIIYAPTGPEGPMGPTGPAGATGSQGAVGPTGTNTTATSAFAYASGTAFTASSTGTPVSLPDGIVLPAGITMDGANTTFTVNVAGRYRIAYTVNTTAALFLGTRIVINGVPSLASTVNPLLSLSNFSNEILVDLAMGATVQLQMIGAGINLTLATGAGATLMITRLS